MHVLVVSSAIPFPPLGGGLLRTYHLLRALSERHDVTLVGFTYGQPHEDSPFPLRVIPVPWEWPQLYQEMRDGDEEISHRAYEVLSSETGEPWFASFYQSPRMKNVLAGLHQDGVDLVLFEGTDMARFLPVFDPGIPKILDLMDVHALMADRVARRKRGEDYDRARCEAERTRRFEKRVANECTICLACSDEEATAARAMLGVDQVAVIPNGVDVSFFSPSEAAIAEDYLLFTGSMDYPPNAEAVHYFTEAILPQIIREVPTVQLHVVGANPGPDLMALNSENVVVHGRVPDMRPYFERAAAVVVPILSGGGTRLKVLEAAACAKPIVTTSLGKEGLDFTNGHDLMVADAPSSFAEAVESLLNAAPLRERLGRNARRTSLQYDWQSIGANLLTVVEETSLKC